MSLWNTERSVYSMPYYFFQEDPSGHKMMLNCSSLYSLLTWPFWNVLNIYSIVCFQILDSEKNLGVSRSSHDQRETWCHFLARHSSLARTSPLQLRLSGPFNAFAWSLSISFNLNILACRFKVLYNYWLCISTTSSTHTHISVDASTCEINLT